VVYRAHSQGFEPNLLIRSKIGLVKGWPSLSAPACSHALRAHRRSDPVRARPDPLLASALARSATVARDAGQMTAS